MAQPGVGASVWAGCLASTFTTLAMVLTGTVSDSYYASELRRCCRVLPRTWHSDGTVTVTGAVPALLSVPVTGRWAGSRVPGWSSASQLSNEPFNEVPFKLTKVTCSKIDCAGRAAAATSLQSQYGSTRPDLFGVFGARNWVSPAVKMFKT